KHSQFKKGQKPPPRKKGQGVDVLGVLEQPVEVAVGGKRKKLPPLEVTLLSLIERVVKKKDMAAAAKLLRLWSEAGIILDPNARRTEVYFLSRAWDPDEWGEMFNKLGPPPWPAPKNGLDNENWREEALIDHDR
ncbi:hypothetical protein KU588_22055, partial [Salmonella enterica subsp. enterica serovar Give]|nr:hypothetical protein [Salmonella enterica subsp. enterica serovar Give]